MRLFGRIDRDPVETRVEAIRFAQRQRGHTLSPLQEGIVRTVATWPGPGDAGFDEALVAITSAIAADGRWHESDEWRLNSWITAAIVARDAGDRPRYSVTVSCEGQTLSCECPTLARAYDFVRLYWMFIQDLPNTIGSPSAAQAGPAHQPA